MPEISVIVPVYDVEKYLPECIESVLQQSFKDFELILVDDESPDRCGEICELYAQKDNRIRVIHQKNGGLSAARNSAIDAARGQYLSFIDSDDVIHVQYLYELYTSLVKYNVDLAICGLKKISANSYDCNKRMDLVEDDFSLLKSREVLLSFFSAEPDRIFASAWGKLYKRELFEYLYFPVGKIHEDVHIIPIVVSKTDKAIFLNRPLYGYRDREGSILNSAFSFRKYDYIDALNHCISYFQDAEIEEVVKAADTHKQEILAYYALLSRNAGIYRELPSEYKMSVLQAIRILRTIEPYNLYSYHVAKVYPHYIFVESRIRKILQVLKILR